jgi:hypothetical protein
VWRRNRIQANLNRKLAAVFAPSEQFPACAHCPRFRRCKEVGAVSRMRCSESFRHQKLNVSANKFVTRVAEQFFGMRIYQRDAALMIDKDRAARRSLCRQVKKFLCLLPFRDVH